MEFLLGGWSFKSVETSAIFGTWLLFFVGNSPNPQYCFQTPRNTHRDHSRTSFSRRTRFSNFRNSGKRPWHRKLTKETTRSGKTVTQNVWSNTFMFCFVGVPTLRSLWRFCFVRVHKLCVGTGNVWKPAFTKANEKVVTRSTTTVSAKTKWRVEETRRLWLFVDLCSLHSTPHWRRLLFAEAFFNRSNHRFRRQQAEHRRLRETKTNNTKSIAW